MTRPDHGAHAHAPADAPTSDAATDTDPDPAAAWESRYADADRVWSGRVNATTADVVATLTPGTAVDLGCGEGGDAVWMAGRGWRVTGVDLSPTAVARGTAAARDRGLDPASITLVAHDLETWAPPAGTSFDLVTASFFQSHVPLDRAGVLRRATTWVAPGGHLLLVAHAARPEHTIGQGGEHRHGDAWSAPDHLFPRPEDELDTLALDPETWDVLLAEVRRREATFPDGRTGMLDDGVVLVRRRP